MMSFIFRNWSKSLKTITRNYRRGYPGKAYHFPTAAISGKIIADANPDEPDSWIYRREVEGLLKIIDFDFCDNPNYFRDGRWTRSAYDYIMQLKKGLTGLNRDRYFLGLRVSASGAVFTLDNCHFIDTLPDLSTYHRYIAIDWGWQAPTVVLWIAWNHTPRRLDCLPRV